MAGMVERHIAALNALKGKSVEAGWFESATYPDGTPVAKVARWNEFGGTINIPATVIEGREASIFKKIDMKSGEYLNDAQFVTKKKSNFEQKVYISTHMRKAYSVVIPARPFMRMAYADFVQNKGALQSRLAKLLFTGKISADQVMGQIGLYLEQCITSSIKNGEFAPNAASTVANKGFNKPLIHTSHMLQTVASKVEQK